MRVKFISHICINWAHIFGKEDWTTELNERLTKKLMKSSFQSEALLTESAIADGETNNVFLGLMKSLVYEIRDTVKVATQPFFSHAKSSINRPPPFQSSNKYHPPPIQPSIKYPPRSSGGPSFTSGNNQGFPQSKGGRELVPKDWNILDEDLIKSMQGYLRSIDFRIQRRRLKLNLCQYYNQPAGCQRSMAQCRWTHLCLFCSREHSMVSCPAVSNVIKRRK